jgi:hypothetical protein
LTARDRWAQAGYTELTLPSGFRVRGVRLPPSELVRRQLMPAQLRAAVVKMMAKPPQDWDAEDLAAKVEESRIIATAFLRDIWDDEACPGPCKHAKNKPHAGRWEPLEVSAADLSAGAFPPDDLEALDSYIFGFVTPEQLRAAVEVGRGMMEAAEAAAITEREAGDTVSGWAAFRDEPGSEAGNPEREDVGLPTVLNPPDNRATRRAGSRRRPRAEARAREAAG